MFEVQEQTARAIFNAQHPKLQGRLRLDISSRSFPADPDQPFDVLNARVAIGERVVQLVKGCAIEAVELTDRAGFLIDAVPPPPDNGLLLLLKANVFEAFVRLRLDRRCGLDPKSRYYKTALQYLATDFYDWCQKEEVRDDFEVNTNCKTVSIRCLRFSAPLSPSELEHLSSLEPAEKWTGSLDD